MENENQLAEPQAPTQEAQEMVNISISVPKQLHDFAEALATMSVAIKDALKDGFQPGQDLPVIVTQAIGQFATIAQNLASVGPSFKENPVASGIVLANALQKLIK